MLFKVGNLEFNTQKEVTDYANGLGISVNPEIIDPIYPDYQGFLNELDKQNIFNQLLSINFTISWNLQIATVRCIDRMNLVLFDPDNNDFRSFYFLVGLLIPQIPPELLLNIREIAEDHSIQLPQ